MKVSMTIMKVTKKVRKRKSGRKSEENQEENQEESQGENNKVKTKEYEYCIFEPGITKKFSNGGV